MYQTHLNLGKLGSTSKMVPGPQELFPPMLILKRRTYPQWTNEERKELLDVRNLSLVWCWGIKFLPRRISPMWTKSWLRYRQLMNE